MFGSNKNTEEVKTTPTSTPNALNALAKGTVVEGSIRCDNDLRIDGTIKGKLTCQSKVIIGPTGAVEGEIKCQNAVIEGRFKGNLHVSELLNVRETAEVDGEITTNKLLVQSGARFNVTCKMDSGSSAANGLAKNADVKSSSHAAAEPVAGGKAESRN
jgi:cytoskeletal protein CcmA (bactofilin family)